MNPDTFSILALALARLDDLLPDARNFHATKETISFQYGRDVGYRGEYETEWERISLTWNEFLDAEGVFVDLNVQCKVKWDAVRAERAKAREEAAALERAEQARLAPILKREKELAELARLKALYPEQS